jgi:fermentation-respiration switch protein FrsA (DUF1100 family)
VKVKPSLLVSCSLLASSCIDSDRLVVFLPVQVDEYELPDNRIPMELLQEIELTSADGTRIFGMLASQPGEARTILFCHGQAENIDEAWGRTQALYDLGHHVLVIDYRGYGKSEGEPSEQGLYQDAQAGYDLLVDRGVTPGRMVIAGFSMGTGVATQLATQNEAAALVLGAAFTSMRELVSGSFPGGVPHGWVSTVDMDTLSRIRSIGEPLVMAHGDEDDRIPYRMGEEVFRHAAEPKTFLRREGVNHVDLIEEAAPEIGRSLEALLGPM